MNLQIKGGECVCIVYGGGGVAGDAGFEWMWCELSHEWEWRGLGWVGFSFNNRKRKGLRVADPHIIMAAYGIDVQQLKSSLSPS